MNQESLLGQQVLGYQVEELIGAGGFGQVYRVSKTNVAGTYTRALKYMTIPTQGQYQAVLQSMNGDYSKADDYFAAMLQDIANEIKILSTLSGESAAHIVQYFENDIFHDEDTNTYHIYILMEFLTPLSQYNQENSFTVGEVITVGKQLAAGLQLCHDNQIIHRDIKEDNIFVDHRGRYKLGDFGVSKLLDGKTRAASVKGTPNYIAPEVYLGREEYDKTVDLYSLGMVLYRLLNDFREPFLPVAPTVYTNEDETTAFQRRMGGERPPLPAHGGQALGEVVVKALQSREHRYPTAAELLQALEQVEDTLSTQQLAQQVTAPVVQRPAPSPVAETLPLPVEKETPAQQATKPFVSPPSAFQPPKETVLLEQSTQIQRTPSEGSAPMDAKAAEAPASAAAEKPAYQPPQASQRAERYPVTAEPERAKLVREKPATKPSKEKGVTSKGRVALFATLSGVLLLLVLAGRFLLPLMGFSKQGILHQWISDLVYSRYPGTVHPVTYFLVNTVLPKVGYVLLIVFLFLLGRELHLRRRPVQAGATLVDEQPRQEMERIVFLLGRGSLDSEGRALRDQAKRLAERFQVETEFGRGTQQVVDCEQQIAEQLDYLRQLVNSTGESRTQEERQAISRQLEELDFLMKERSRLQVR